MVTEGIDGIDGIDGTEISLHEASSMESKISLVRIVVPVFSSFQLSTNSKIPQGRDGYHPCQKSLYRLIRNKRAA